jgi:hypothetical protein
MEVKHAVCRKLAVPEIVCLISELIQIFRRSAIVGPSRPRTVASEGLEEGAGETGCGGGGAKVTEGAEGPDEPDEELEEDDELDLESQGGDPGSGYDSDSIRL